MNGQGMSTIVMLVLLFALMYFMMIRPENKRKKKAEEMRSNLKKGDTITTIGGIIGKVVKVNENTLVIETSEDRVRMEITKWAISTTGVQTGETADTKKKCEKKEEAPAEEAAPEKEIVDEIPAPESEEEK